MKTPNTQQQYAGFRNLTALLALTLVWCAYGSAQTFSSGSTGADGELTPTSDLVIDMSDHPDGVYHYTSVNIPRDITVSFIPNEENTPVTWLVSGDVYIDGALNLDGQEGRADDDPLVSTPGSEAQGGPGGFPGGLGGIPASESLNGSAGHGPGAGKIQDRYYGLAATSEYISRFAIPLIGGSGGGGGAASTVRPGGQGGGGGGAILIAADGTTEITYYGRIFARRGDVGAGNSGGGHGSGGAIRLIATTIQGSGSVYAGVIRMEAFTLNYTGGISAEVYSSAGAPGVLSLPDAPPRLKIATIDGDPVPADPAGQSSSPDVTLSSDDPVTLQIEGQNIPPGSAVTIHAIPEEGARVEAFSGLVGTFESSQALAQMTIPRGNGVLEAFAQYEVALPEPSTITVEGQEVNAVLLQTKSDGGTEVLYVTKDGKIKAAPEPE